MNRKFFSLAVLLLLLTALLSGSAKAAYNNFFYSADLYGGLFAINPDTPENTRETVEKFRLPFPVLSDTKMEAAQACGVAFRVTDRDEEYYEKLRRASGETHRILPVPSYFVVGRDEVIKYAYVNPNYRQRPPFDLMLAAVNAVVHMEQAEDA